MRRYLLEAAPLCLFAVVFFSWLSVRPGFIGNISDSAFYLTVADYFSPYWSAAPGLGASLFHDFSFPPLYPLLLAAGGGGSEHPGLSYLATSCMMAFAVGAVYLWFRTERLSRAQASGLTAVYALLPATLLSAMAIQSESLYVAFVFTGLALWRARDTKAPLAPLAAVCIGMSALARTVGLTAIGALLISWFIARPASRHWSIPVLAVAPYAAWVVVRYSNGMQPSYIDSVLRESVTATLVSLMNQGTINVPAMWFGIVHSVDLTGSPFTTVASAAFLALAVLGMAPRLRRLEIDSLYVLFYLVIMMVWPYPDHMRRFLQVLFPLLLFYSFSGVRHAMQPLAPSLSRTAGNAYIVILAVVIAPTTVLMAQQIAQAEGKDAENFVRSPQWYRYDSPFKAREVMDRVTQILDGMRGIDERLPPDACVSSAAYAYIPLYGHRRSRRVAGESDGDDQLFSQLRGCPYVFMMAASQWPQMDYPAMYPYERIKDQLEVVEVSLWDRTATTGTVLTMLGRVRFDKDGEPER